jgi:maltooligosyltrehalose trehalohydrolase
MSQSLSRALSVSPVVTTPGTERVGEGTRFQIFTDRAQTCAVRLLRDDGSTRSTHPLTLTDAGWHEATLPGVRHGTLYDFLLDGRPLPDPYARFFPRGVLGPAMVVESDYVWRHGQGIWRPLRDHVIYELHVGTFTPEGTYEAARSRLAALVDLGVTTLELMPLSAFAGRRGWGYDGVAHFAPFAGYGAPDDLRRLIDEAHGLGLSVLLDAVYNHFGPAGNYLPAFSSSYFTSEIKTAWGDGPDFRRPLMRNYVLGNARYWLTDFRFDGLRLDATHAIIDPSPTHILKELSDMVRTLEPRKILIAEDERNTPELVSGLGLDGVWADDFHHVAHVVTTRERDGYYGGYAPDVAQLAETIRKGWLYDGQINPTTGKPRGQPAGALPAQAFIYCLQNHDQVGNRALGDRPLQGDRLDAHCALSTLLMFLPMTPLLFMGQEWAATTPFQFFTDHEAELGRLISRGRRDEFKSFQAFSDGAARDQIPDPQAEETFTRSKLRWEERDAEPHQRVLRLYRALIRLRRSDPVLRASGRDGLTAFASDQLLVVRLIGESDGDGDDSGAGHDRLLVANLSDGDCPRAAVEAVRSDIAGRALLLRSDGLQTFSGALPAWTAVITAGPISSSSITPWP